MVTLLVAFLSLCTHQSSAWELVWVGVVSVLLIVAAIIWCIMMAWSPHGQLERVELEAMIRQAQIQQVQVQVQVAEEQGDQLEEHDDEARLTRPWKASWSWPGFLFRRKMSASDTAVIPMHVPTSTTPQQ